MTGAKHIFVPEGQEEIFLAALFPIERSDDWGCPECKGKNILSEGLKGETIYYKINRLWNDEGVWRMEQERLDKKGFHMTTWIAIYCQDCDWKEKVKSVDAANLKL